MIAEDVVYSYADTQMRGRFYSPDTEGKRPGILVVHGAHGLNGFIEGVSERLAAQDFAVLAVDLWGGREQISNPDAIGARLGQMASEGATWMGRLEAARQALMTLPSVDRRKIGVLGYCFGGTTALEFARTGHDVKAVVSFHGGLDQVGQDWSKARDLPVLICTGSADPLVPLEQMTRVQAQMSGAGVAWELNLYGGAKHAFTEPDPIGGPPRPPFAAYDARADYRSWLAMSEFFADVFA